MVWVYVLYPKCSSYKIGFGFYLLMFQLWNYNIINEKMIIEFSWKNWSKQSFLFCPNQFCALCQYFLFEKITKFITLLTYRQYSYFFTYLENNLYTILYFKTYNLLLPIILATYFLQFYILFYHFTLKKTHIINTFSFVNTTKYIPLFYYAKKHKKIPWRFISNKST